MVNPRIGPQLCGIVKRRHGIGCTAGRPGARNALMVRSTAFSRLAAMLFAALAGLALSSCGPNVAKADSYEQMADGMLAAGAYPAAMQTMERSIKQDPNEPRRWVKLGRAQRNGGQPALAAMSFQRALDLEPANLEALENMAILLVRAGRYDEAKGYVDPLMSLSPDDIGGLMSLGAIAMFKQNWDEANKQADRLMQIAPTSIGGFTLKANVLASQGKFAQAAEILAKQVALNPTDPDLAQQLMHIYSAAHDVNGIRATSLILANLQPDDPRYQMESARALHAKGRDAEADAIVERLRQRFRGNADMMEAIADFWLGSLPRDQALQRIIALTGQLGGNIKARLADRLIDEGQAVTVVRLLASDAQAEVTPANNDLQASYARALLAVGKPRDAEAAADKVLAFDGSNTGALIVRAHILLALKQYPEALTASQIAASNDSTNEEGLMLVPQVYAAMGNKILTEQAWGTAQSRLPKSVAINQGRIGWLVSQGRTDDAIQILATFARGVPSDVGTWRRYVALCQQAKNDCARRAKAQLDFLTKS
jgi:tetratricopeptide (TPR) repeat protein